VRARERERERERTRTRARVTMKVGARVVTGSRLDLVYRSSLDPVTTLAPTFEINPVYRSCLSLYIDFVSLCIPFLSLSYQDRDSILSIDLVSIVASSCLSLYIDLVSLCISILSLSDQDPVSLCISILSLSYRDRNSILSIDLVSIVSSSCLHLDRDRETIDRQEFETRSRLVKTFLSRTSRVLVYRSCVLVYQECRVRVFLSSKNVEFETFLSRQVETFLIDKNSRVLVY